MTNKTINIHNGDNTPCTTATLLIKSQIDYEPKVSVIIPVYNVEKYLRQCLDSVVNQTLKEIEIICVDDGSTDSSLEILKEYASKDPRFTIITQENLYAGIARNAGIMVAKGKYIWFIDADDYIEKNSIELLIQKNNDCDIILIGYKDIFENKIKENTKHCFLDYQLTKNVRKNAFKAPSTIWDKIFKRQFILNNKLYFDKIKVCNDVFFAYWSMITAASITTIPECLYNYRKEALGALSRTRGEYSHLITYAFNNIKSNLIKHNLFKQYKKFFYKKYFQHIDYELNCCSNLSQKTNLYLSINKYDLYRLYYRNFIKNLLKIKKTNNHIKIILFNIKFTFRKDLFYKIIDIEYNQNNIKINFLGIKLKIKDKSLEKFKNFFLYPVKVREEYKQLKSELKSLKK